jgi:transposase
MRPYSEDLRRKVVDALERGMNKSEAARLFGVSLSSIERYARLARDGRSLKPGKVPGKRPKIDERGKRLLEAGLEGRPAASLLDRCKFLEWVVGVKVSTSTVSRLLKRLAWSRKKGWWVRPSGTNG